MEVLIIGLGRFGTSVAMSLANDGVDVTVVDIDEDRVKDILDSVEDGYVLNSADEKALKEIAIEHFDRIVLALGKSSMNASLLTALNLKELGLENVTAKASSVAHYKLLKKIGVEDIVQPEFDMGKKIATKIKGSSLIDYVELSSDVKIDNVKVDAKLKKLQNKTIQDINLRKKFKVNIISIQRNDTIIVPESDTLIKSGDILIIIGKNEDIYNFEKNFKLM